MTKFHALAVLTRYWKTNDNYLDIIIAALKNKPKNGDYIVISEKAISIAQVNILDETIIKASANAKLIARFWMRLVWGYPLGILCGFGHRLLKRLREYPVESGSRHKQVALEQAGLMQALMFGSEGGIDGSNLAYSYVSLPLRDAYGVARKIRKELQKSLGKNVCVIIADTDKTYKLRNFYFTPRPNPMRGIHSFGGIITYTIGRMLKLKRSSTPLAVAGCALSPSEALKITNMADRARGSGSGATVWDMAARFQVGLNAVSWEMLETLGHKPIIIVRRITE